MSEAKPAGIKSALSGWVKGLITSALGLLSGAFIMYLTPVVNSAIKPAKPVANFAVQVSGHTVNFNNRSTGATQGWWDFGDGSALEPYDPKSETVQHGYPRSGSYNVKLTLTNLIGDEDDRSVTVVIDQNNLTGPTIDSFELKPYTSSERAPAVFILTSKVKNAGFCILSLGDHRPTEIIDASADMKRLINFDEMGSYTVRLAAVNGKQLVEKTDTIFISPNEGLEPTAKLLVSYQAIKVERFPPRDWRIRCDWQGDDNQSVSSFRKVREATDGCKIVSAELVNNVEKDGSARDVKWEISPDKKSIVLTGELVRPSGLLTPKSLPPAFVGHMRVTLERRSAPQSINRGAVTMAVDLNKTTKIPMQPLEEGWELISKNASLELWDGTRKVWEGSKAVTNAKVTLKSQPCLVTAIPQTDSYLLKIDAPTYTKGGASPVVPASSTAPTSPIGPAIRPASFDRNLLKPVRPKN